MSSWQRLHDNETIDVRIIDKGSQHWISVSEPRGQQRLPAKVVCPSSGVARTKADELVLQAYPHDCRPPLCTEWVQFGVKGNT